MKIYYLTGNEGKFRAAKLVIPEIEKLDIDLPEIQEINPKKIIEAKLIEANKHKNGRFMVSDGSLYLEAIPGLPGPLIKWFEKTIGNQGLFQLAKKMGNFDAYAKVIVGYMDDQDNIDYFEGEIRGKIVKPRGLNGYGWDEIFQPQGYKKTFAEMTFEEKNKISHGRIALEKLREHLRKE
jgi:non-canonical purine NTP pyrophosphatase (RdgB/HAM1 family)